MVQRHHGFESGLSTGIDDPGVVVKRGARELTLFGFDAAPFEREAVRVEAKLRQPRDVLPIAVVVVTGVTARFHA